MTVATDLLVDALDRVRESVHSVLDGLERPQLTYRVDPEANTVAWLVWHLTRVEDDHVADVAGRAQAWHEDGWYDRFGLPFGRDEHGYGHTPSRSAPSTSRPSCSVTTTTRCTSGRSATCARSPTRTSRGSSTSAGTHR